MSIPPQTVSTPPGRLAAFVPAQPGVYTVSVEVYGFGKFAERVDLSAKPASTKLEQIICVQCRTPIRRTSNGSTHSIDG
jgi:hypothetical protein